MGFEPKVSLYLLVSMPQFLETAESSYLITLIYNHYSQIHNRELF